MENNGPSDWANFDLKQSLKKSTRQCLMPNILALVLVAMEMRDGIRQS